jgi:hypothetical protein
MKYNLIWYSIFVNAYQYGNGNRYFYICARHRDKFVEEGRFVESI